jgi:thiol-disulfide isomerase/thioredoxin
MDIQPFAITHFAITRYVCALCFICSLCLPGGTSAGEISPYVDKDSAAPDFTLQDLDGTTHRLDAYRGKVLLINFWASWCPPCVTELPSMQRLANQLSNEAFQVLLVNVGESSFRVAKFMKLLDIRLTALLDTEGGTFKAWGADVYPTSYILDGTGKIRYIARGPLEWDDGLVVETLRGMMPDE